MNILVFGDSIAHGSWDPKGGWVSRLRELSVERNGPRIWNLSRPGETTTGLRHRIKRSLDERMRGETMVMIAEGINDARETKGERTTPEKDFNYNINALIEFLKSQTPHVLFVGLTPVDEERTNPLEWNEDTSYENDVIRRYDGAIKNLCEDASVPYVHLFDGFLSLEDPWEDGLHPNSSGHRFIFRRVRRFLLEEKIIPREGQ